MSTVVENIPGQYEVEDQPLDSQMTLSMGPQHPSTHGVLRLDLRMDGELVVKTIPDIGYLHTGMEKLFEYKKYQQGIVITDRMDYLNPLGNNLAYVMAAEKLLDLEIPERAQVIRVLMCELQRIASHMVWLGTHALDIGAMSVFFYCFRQREKILNLIESASGGRMTPSYFRIGGLMMDLPAGFERRCNQFLADFPEAMNTFETLVTGNTIWQSRTQGIGVISAEEAIDWGITGPMLRACGFEWDFRKKRPYSGYEQFQFDIPTGKNGDCFDRALVRVEEMRQSLRIIEQCVNQMPEGPYKSDHPLASPPLKDRTMHDIETLITHFLSVSWGPVIPPGEALGAIEGTKGNNGYYLVSDGGTNSYRTRIRTPSFPHIQALPLMCRGRLVPDLLAVLGAMDFVLADIDR